MRLCVLFLALPGFSQDSSDKREAPGSRLEALKIAYLTRRLDLTPGEAQQFWPVYNLYTRDMRELRIQQMRRQKPELENEEEILQLRKKYQETFSGVLGAEKTNNFFKLEKDFRNYVQKELAERRKQRQQPQRERESK